MVNNEKTPERYLVINPVDLPPLPPAIKKKPSDLYNSKIKTIIDNLRPVKRRLDMDDVLNINCS